MGSHIQRTAADDLTDAQAALNQAQRALRDLQSHLDGIIANPEGAAAKAHAAKRNAGIVQTQFDDVRKAVQALVQRGALDALGRLDGTSASAVALLSGLTRAELDAVGGVRDAS